MYDKTVNIINRLLPEPIKIHYKSTNHSRLTLYPQTNAVVLSLGIITNLKKTSWKRLGDLFFNYSGKIWCQRAVL